MFFFGRVGDTRTLNGVSTEFLFVSKSMTQFTVNSSVASLQKGIRSTEQSQNVSRRIGNSMAKFHTRNMWQSMQ